MVESLADIWEQAEGMDATLRGALRHSPALKRKRRYADPYVRSRLFASIAKGRPALLTHFPVRLKGAHSDAALFLPKLLCKGFPASHKARVQMGASRTQRSLCVSEVMGLWERGRAILGVTDLHFRGTRFADAMDFSALTEFDVLCRDRRFIEEIEMMTVVISSKGNVTDSHQDDCDGSNHCFVGKKLWLAWDRLEGKTRGFQDVDRDQPEGAAAFDIGTFLRLRSSCWFIIKQNQTLFLNGSLAHKVICLEPYIGIGGFNVTLPGCLRSLRRWQLYDTLDIKQKNLFEPICRALRKRINELQRSDQNTQDLWGVKYLRAALVEWQKREPARMKKTLMANAAFAEFLEAALPS